MKTKIELKYKSDKEFTGINENGNEVKVDMRAPEEKEGQSPMEMLLSALAACAGVEIVSMIKKRRKEFVDLQAVMEGDRREEHPKAYTKIHLKYIITSPDLTEEEATRIVDLATTKYCSVAGSVGAEQTHSFEIKRP